MKYIETCIALPPGLIPPEAVRALLRRVFEDYQWFQPRRYGFVAHDNPLPPGPSWYDALLEYYTDSGLHAFSVAASTDKDYMMLYPAKSDMPPYVGELIWGTSVRAAARSTWRDDHARQVMELMLLLGSPLAMTATEEDFDSKAKYIVDHGTYGEQTLTVRDYSEGLAGLYWRNFYGPPFVRLFGERLNALPPECVTRLVGELVLVQPYELPTEAGTKAARAREQQLISLLGPECFYDHEHHRPPSRRPVLPPPPWPAPAT